MLAQTWDKNFYDKKILYDNADLLQLSAYEQKKLKQKIDLENQEENIYSFEAVNIKALIKENKTHKEKQFLFTEISYRTLSPIHPANNNNNIKASF
tara:strand:- start:5533 stop:5820 length:288 start_codon:yes stop_codon:yes gene_type:complete